jgi:hypothetical protein
MIYLSERSTVYILLCNPLPCLGIFSHFRVELRTSEFARERSRARLIGMSGDRSGCSGCSTSQASTTEQSPLSLTTARPSRSSKMMCPTPSQPSGSAPSPLSPHATLTSETMPFGSPAFLPAAAPNERTYWAGFLPPLPTRDHQSVLGPLLAFHLSESKLRHLAKESATLK